MSDYNIMEHIEEEEEDRDNNSSSNREKEKEEMNRDGIKTDHKSPQSAAYIPKSNSSKYNNKSMLPLLPKLTDSLTNFIIYETKTRYYIIATTIQKKYYRLIKIDRTNAMNLTVDEDPTLYDLNEINSVLYMTMAGNSNMKKITHAYGIVGFIKFLQGYYLIVITKRKRVGSFGAHIVYSIEDTMMIYIPHESAVECVPLFCTASIRADEIRYKNLFQVVDLTKIFYFSYTYDLTNTLQSNMISSGTDLAKKSMYIWNKFLINNFCHPLGGICSWSNSEEHLHDHNPFVSDITPCESSCKTWMLPVIHGYFEQSRILVFGRELDLTLLSRRSCLFAGTRYLKRGISDSGYVANDVETEQIFFDRLSGGKCGQFTSYVQMRASIPAFWCQDGNLMTGQPAIRIYKSEPVQNSLQKHVNHLFQRYGTPLLMVNLVRQTEKQPREKIVGSAFSSAISYLNQFLPIENKIDYWEWDFKKVSKSKTDSVVDELFVISEWALQRTGIFHSSPKDVIPPACSATTWEDACPENIFSFPPKIRPSIDSVSKLQQNLGWLQRGALRSNCIDSLDRTNVAQFCVGKCAMGYQLHAMGIIQSTKLDFDSEFISVLLEMYERMGDAIALQYGGSQMHRSLKKDRDKSTTMAPVLYRTQPETASKEIMVSIMRHYSNTFQDRVRQDSMNVLLGYFSPSNSFKDDLFSFAPLKEESMFSKFVKLVKGDEEEYFYPDEIIMEDDEDLPFAPIRPLKKSTIYYRAMKRDISPILTNFNSHKSLYSFPSPDRFFLGAKIPNFLSDNGDIKESEYKSLEFSSTLTAKSIGRVDDFVSDSKRSSTNSSVESSVPNPQHNSSVIEERTRNLFGSAKLRSESANVALLPRDLSVLKNKIELHGRRKKERINVWDLVTDYYLHNKIQFSFRAIAYYDNPNWWKSSVNKFDSLLIQYLNQACNKHLISLQNAVKKLDSKIFIRNIGINISFDFYSFADFSNLAWDILYSNSTITNFDKYFCGQNAGQILDYYGSEIENAIEVNGNEDSTPYYYRPRNVRLSGSGIATFKRGLDPNNLVLDSNKIKLLKVPVTKKEPKNLISNPVLPLNSKNFVNYSRNTTCSTTFDYNTNFIGISDEESTSFWLLTPYTPTITLVSDVLSVAASSLSESSVVSIIPTYLCSTFADNQKSMHIYPYPPPPLSYMDTTPFGSFLTTELPPPTLSVFSNESKASLLLNQPAPKPRLRNYTAKEDPDDESWRDCSKYQTLKYADKMSHPFEAIADGKNHTDDDEFLLVDRGEVVLKIVSSPRNLISVSSRAVKTANSALEEMYAQSVHYKRTNDSIERLNYLNLCGTSSYSKKEIGCYVDYCYNLITENLPAFENFTLYETSPIDVVLMNRHFNSGFNELDFSLPRIFPSSIPKMSQIPVGIAFVESNLEYYKNYMDCGWIQ